MWALVYALSAVAIDGVADPGGGAMKLSAPPAEVALSPKSIYPPSCIVLFPILLVYSVVLVAWPPSLLG
jgi:hypothetical protein